MSPLFAAMALATLAACSESTGPVEEPDVVSGTYVMTSRAGLPLPVQVGESANTRTMLISGTLRISKVQPSAANENANYTFTLSSQFQTIGKTSGTITPLTEGKIGFAWITAANALTYSTLLFDGSAFLTGRFANGTLTYGTFEYRLE